MRIKIITVSKNKFDYLQEAENDYLGRLKQYAQLEIIYLKEEPITKNRNLEEIIEIEGERILGKIDSDYFNIALHVYGQAISSEKFADMVREVRDFKNAQLCFIIGGPLGISQRVLSQVDFILSFSKMTFTHQLIRLFLLEQIYRAFEIIKGSQYHK